MNQIWEYDKKPSFGPDFGPLHPTFGRQFSFFKNLATSATRCHGQLSSRTISEKNNGPILRKLSDGRTDRRTDGQTDRGTNRSGWVISYDTVRLKSSVQYYSRIIKPENRRGWKI